MLWTLDLHLETWKLLEQCTSGWLALEWWCPQPALIGICVEVLWNSWARRSLDFALVAARSRRHSKKIAVHTDGEIWKDSWLISLRYFDGQSDTVRVQCAVHFHFARSLFSLSMDGCLMQYRQDWFSRGWQVAIFWMMEAGIVDLSAVELFGAEVEMLWVSLLPCGEFSTCGFFISSIGTARCSRCSCSLAEILAGHDSTLERYLFLCLMGAPEALCL